MSVRLTSSSTSNYAYIVRDITAEAIATNGAFTICGWFKPVAWVTYSPMLAVTNSLASRASSVELYGSGDGTSPDYVFYAAGGSGGTNGAYSFANGDWVFRAWTSPGTNFNHAHYAGNAASGDLTQHTGLSYGPPSAFNYVIAGELAQPGLVQAFNGEVEHVRVWKSELSEAELRTERDATTPQKTGCFLAWSLVDASDTADITGNGRTWTGTTVGTGTVTNGASNSPPGAYGGGGGPASGAAFHYYRQAQ